MRFFDWRGALVIVKPDTFIKWHRTAFRAFWRWKSRKRGRPSLPKNLMNLIREMDRENPTWGEGQIAADLKLKLGYPGLGPDCSEILERGLPSPHFEPALEHLRSESRKGNRGLRFLHLCHRDLRVLYVFVAMEIGSRRILHCNVTEHPAANWTIRSSANSLLSTIRTDS